MKAAIERWSKRKIASDRGQPKAAMNRGRPGRGATDDPQGSNVAGLATVLA
jgi:hypothetical protein